MVDVVIGTILESFGLSLFIHGLGHNPLTVGDTHSSSDFLDGNRNTGSFPISPLSEVVLLWP